MKFRKTLLAALLAATLGALAQSPMALASVEIYMETAPPALRYERVPSARRGYVWAPGYWDSNRGRHAWKRGHWERERANHYYVQPRWMERNNRWELERGRWNPNDRDGDGVPNNRDRQPDNPNRR